MTAQSNVYFNPKRPGKKKWIGQVELAPVVINGKVKRHRQFVYAETYEKGVQLRAEAALKINKGALADPEKITVADNFIAWLEDKKSRRIRPIKPTTENSYREWIARLNAEFGGVRVRDLTAPMVEAAFRKFTDEGLSDSFQSSLYFAIRDALAFAIDEKKITENVTDDVERPQPSDDEMKFLTPEEANEMLREAGGSRFYALLHLAVSTGLREGELLGLHWEDIHDGEIHVKHTLRTYKDRLVVDPPCNGKGCNKCGARDGRGPPKSKSGYRAVTLTKDADGVLLKWRERLLREGLAGSPWVFPSSVGTPILPSNVRKAFKAALRRADVRDVRFHDLRHTFASIAFDRGYSLLEIQRMLGHSDGEMTKRYAHIFEKSRKQKVERMNGVFPSTMEAP